MFGRAKHLDEKSIRLREYAEKLEKTEVIHEILGPCRYMTEQQDYKQDLDEEPKLPYWCARPDGWNNGGFELLVSGTSVGLNRASEQAAVEIYNRLNAIAEQASSIYTKSLEPSWANCINDPAKVVFQDPNEQKYPEPPDYFAELDSKYNVIQVNRSW